MIMYIGDAELLTETKARPSVKTELVGSSNSLPEVAQRHVACVLH